MLFFDKTPLRAYKNCGLEISGAQKHIKTCCFWMRPRSGLIKTMVWRAVVAQSILKLVVYERDVVRQFAEKLSTKSRLIKKEKKIEKCEWVANEWQCIRQHSVKNPR